MRLPIEITPNRRRANFAEGDTAAFEKWLKTQPQEFQDDWEANKEKYGDKFKKKAGFAKGDTEAWQKWMESQPQEFQDEWEANKEKYKDKFKKKAYLDPAIREEVLPMLRIVLAILRAQYLSYQTSHWQTLGPAYYGNHLLFQRLYEGVQEEIDALGEKLVGYFGIEAVDLEVSLDLIFEMVSRWCSHESHFQRGLTSEGELQDALAIIRNGWPEAYYPMPLGLDDWLAATANAHESNQYLLQQVLGAPASEWPAVMGRNARIPEMAPSAEDDFYDNPRKRETREFAETGAPTNLPDVAKDFAKQHGDGKVMRQVRKTPPTPEEILEKQPGAEGASTLSRLVVKSEEPDIAPAAIANRALMANWLKQINN